MAKLIDVEERDIDYIFGKNKPYRLDVYQRDYRWSDSKDYKIVSQLLWDIELRFENNLKVNKRNNIVELPEILSDVSANFKAYFLNTIMLNEQDGDIFIVDGQQRLTTILLILIKLYHIGKNNIVSNIINVEKILGEKIYEEDKAGIKHFKISNIDRNKIISKIFHEEEIKDEDINNITQSNLVNNYAVISKYFDKYFANSKNEFDSVKYNYYIYNLTEKVLIIEQVIKHKEDVAMIFETANDRGKSLESHEVLKGMLLGVLEGEEKEVCNTIWNNALTTFFDIDGNYKNVDEFFRTYFRAKYADNRSQYDSFAGKYHRNLLSNEKIINDLDRNNPNKIKSFIENEFLYFYKTYIEIFKIAKEETNIWVGSNYANDRGQQALLILSALNYNDSEKSQKIALIAKKVDQLFTIAKLTGFYDNNAQQQEYHNINREIRGKRASEINEIFTNLIVKHLNKQGLPVNSYEEIFQYTYFQSAKNDGRFTKYILARIDHYLADLLSEQSFAKQESLYEITHSGNKPVNGFHTEHIFAFNDKIMNEFTDEKGEYDENLFLTERNRLGAVILLKGNENIRLSNWIYKRKRKSYSDSGFIWNRILTDSINKASINSCNDDIKEHFKSYLPNEKGLLDKEVIEERQKLLFKIIKRIYS
ncbi:DUF262 domain-containing protein [Xanthomarina gelatinilytica]|uniref:DUF262 domain-containing protein n=1 Tax=Xanthomarina gelatinilytica TaxID=1137281 RepID=UPI003AA96016